MSDHDDLSGWEKVWEEYDTFIVLYFTVIFAVLGAFVFGMWIVT